MGARRYKKRRDGELMANVLIDIIGIGRETSDGSNLMIGAMMRQAATSYRLELQARFGG
jgi:hypothetical protein